MSQYHFQVKEFYGDTAYFTQKNRRWLNFFEKYCKFHDKEESGKNRLKKRSAKQKSRIRSKIEAMFGILEGNYKFGRTEVRGLVNLRIEMSLQANAWNLFFLLSYLVGRFEDRISLRKLFYEN